MFKQIYLTPIWDPNAPMLQARADLRERAMKGYSILPRAGSSIKYHCLTQDTPLLGWGSI